VLRYGMAREMVLGLEVVLPDGTLLTSLDKMLKNNAGYDLKQLLIGSEGTLGIIARIVLRLFPRPHCTMAALCRVPSYEAMLSLLSPAHGSLGPLLSAFEVMWPDYWEIATRRVAACRARLAREIPAWVSFFYGHIADGNMHIIACVPDAAEQPNDAIDTIVYVKCAASAALSLPSMASG
jgi:FAD/FMN-containing dehydrogenase